MKRISIIKTLNERRKTLMELSRELKTSKSTLHENLSILIQAELILRKDGDNKFVYYELSEKGKKLLNSDGYIKVTISLVISILSLFAGLENLYKSIKFLVYPPPGLEHEYFVVFNYLLFSMILLLIASVFGIYALRSWKKIH